MPALKTARLAKFATRSAKLDVAPAAPTPDFIDPSELPDRYAMIVQGVCLEPEIKDGDCLMFDKTVPYKAGDLVILFKRPERVQPGRLPAIVKRLVMAPPPWVKFPHVEHPNSDVHALLIAEQFNPKGSFAIPCADLLAVHKCLGPVPAEMKCVPTTEAAARAMNRAKLRKA